MLDFSPDTVLVIPAAFMMSFLFSLMTIPPIVTIAQKKNLLVYPNHRDSHNGGIPRLGGLAIFIAIVFPLIFFSGINTVLYFRNILSAVIVLFFIGLLDDIINVAAWEKLAWEAMAVSLVIFGGKMYFSNLFGFLGIHELYYIPAVIISIIIYVSIINAFNLVDGIDGLASGLCIQIGIFFGIFFFLEGDYQFTVITAIVTGAVTGFFIYNSYSKKYKIFMGDSGSLVLGLFIGLMVWRFCLLNMEPGLVSKIQAAPAVAMGMLAVPLFDTFRVIVIRIFHKKSPFVADRQHIHHLLLDLGFSHRGVRSILIGFNVLISFSALVLQAFTSSVTLFLLLLLSICIIFTVILVKIRQRKHLKSPPGNCIENFT